MPSPLTRERMLEIAAECDKYEITLANDPTVLGNTHLQDQVATCRNFTNHAARLLNEVHRAKMGVELELRRKQTAFKIAADDLLANNAIVRNLPNIKDRESQINIMLRDDHREILNLENDLLELTHIEDYVRRRHRELKDTMREIQTQRNLIKDDRTTGGAYGDERPTSMGARDEAFTPGGSSKPDDMDVKDIEKMLSDAKAPEASAETPEEEAPKSAEITVPEVRKEEPVAPVAAAPEPPPPAAPVVPQPKSEEEEIHSFLAKEEAPAPLNGPHVVPSDSSGDDFAELLAQL